MSNFTPTPEQDAIYTAVEAGHDVVVAAGAGAGKTSTIVGIAERTEGSGMLVCFNAAPAKEAAAKLKGTGWTARTAHSLAYGWMVRQPGLKNRFDAGRPDYKTVRTFVGARKFQLNGEHNLDAFQIVGVVKEAHKKFCDSADPELNERHVRRAIPQLPEGVSPQPLINYVLPLAKRYSADALSPTGTMEFFQQESLKSYQLSNPTLAINAIGYDEAQDANPVILDIVRNQRCQKIVVGDSNQQIYEWRGAVDALDRFAEMDGVVTLGLTKSFRFGQAVADIANLFLTALDSRINGEPFRITGNEKMDSKIQAIETPNAVLCRSNAGCLEEAMSYLEDGKKVAIVGNGDDLRKFANGARELMTDPKSDGGRGTNNPELSAFNNWDEVLEYVEQGEADATFKRLVQLIGRLGVGTILHVLNSLVDEKNADVVISTAHKAKGREWGTVRIAADFKPPEEDQEPSKSELRLAYVAVTRAMNELDLGGLAWIRNYVNQEVAA